MAAHSSSFIRLRLHFDYPPPAVVDCRMCWLLVDLNKCRVVADLESIIREKFEFSRRSILSLFLEDYYLPHTENIYVVRDNDSIRVKVDSVPQVNGHDSCPDTATENCRKRQRATEEDRTGEHELSVERKKKKKKKSEESTTAVTKQVQSDDRSKKSQVNHVEEEEKKKKKKKKDAEKNCPAATPDPAPSPKKPPATVNQAAKISKKPQVTPPKAKKASSSDSSSSSSSEEDKAPKKPASKKPTSTPAAPKAPSNLKPAQKKSQPPPSSSSSSDSSSDEATSFKIHPKNKPATLNAPKSLSVLQSTNCAQKPAASTVPPPRDKGVESRDSDSEEEIQLVIKRPLPQPALGGLFPWRGRGRGNARQGGGGGGGHGERGRGRGRGAGRGNIRGNGGSFEPCYNGARESSSHTDSLTNLSVVLQNKTESAPKQDYSSMPLLAAPPQVGQKIAFKLLELTENYTPEVSEYKEGKMMSFDPTTKQIEIKLFNACQAPVEPGKFDLVYQNPDGSESVEYTVSRGSWVTERWESLLEPRLII